MRILFPFNWKTTSSGLVSTTAGTSASHLLDIHLTPYGDDDKMMLHNDRGGGRYATFANWLKLLVDSGVKRKSHWIAKIE
ncbi:hypothetical protein RHMOL_Rhmol08G0138300 [Rhododendron molle]|uniref:Uncharacterized protein n=1 Tax=Rhododendron molle TaxID=49168 RepID=A0ACC0MNV2_RHOML|nr:hypothetical protein RHMOL_Rhmol08G0138300 [Rhododendron molle]